MMNLFATLAPNDIGNDEYPLTCKVFEKHSDGKYQIINEFEVKDRSNAQSWLNGLSFARQRPHVQIFEGKFND